MIGPTQEKPSPPTAPILRILVVDDHASNRKVVELMLQQVGVAFASVCDGAEACHAFASTRFDAVLMDVHMPVMDGLAATRRMRALEAADRRARTPILMLTANALPEDVDASRAAGADRHLTKPVHPAALYSALQLAIDGIAQAA